MKRYIRRKNNISTPYLNCTAPYQWLVYNQYKVNLGCRCSLVVLVRRWHRVYVEFELVIVETVIDHMSANRPMLTLYFNWY
mgnify:CR=1 FL=1